MARQKDRHLASERTHPKDVGLAFPRKLKPKKAKGKSVSRETSIPESALQEHAEATCIDMGLHFVRIPDEVLRYIYATPGTPLPVIDAANAYINGFPDLFVLDERGNYLCLELKRDTETAKLRASQKRFLMGKRTKVCRTKAEITKTLQDFANQ